MRRLSILALVSAVALALQLGLLPAIAASTPAASLQVSPSTYVGGQAVTFAGNIGASGVRRVGLQFNINRPGDPWQPVAGFSRTTKANGDFSFGYEAPGMFGISYRVVSGGLTTPKYTFDPKSQDITLALVGADKGWYGTTAADTPFSFAVDTTPTLPRRLDSAGLPVFEGRRLTLQERQTTGTWRTVATSAADAKGEATFAGLSEPQGVSVYRVRQENWTGGGSRVGWFPSFPYYVYSGVDAPVRAGGQDAGDRVDGGTNPKGGIAAQVYGWGDINYDFAWEQGESLESAPDRGTQSRGYWQDYSSGSGRAMQHNGGFALVSGRLNDAGPGDFGNTWLTMRRAEQVYGRWELRMRSKTLEKGQGDYRMLALLVPADDRRYGCGEHNVILGEIASGGTSMTYGVNAGRTQWRATKQIGSLDDQSPAFAVEVAKNHMTWFFDGKAIGTVRSRSVASGIPMTLRVALIGQGETEMDHTSLFSDWQRSYPLGKGRQVTRGPALGKTTKASAC